MSQIVRRSQGRPVRGREEVGRQRIVDGTLAYFRSSKTDGWARKDIAEFAGVTPALISYYFTSPADLISAVACPVIEGYTNQMAAVIASDLSTLEKLHEVIRIFLNCHRTDWRLIEAVETLTRENVLQILDFRGSLFRYSESFFQTQVQHEIFDAAFLCRALWGMCALVARQSDPAYDLVKDRVDQSFDQSGGRADFSEWVFLLATNGLSSTAGRQLC